MTISEFFLSIGASYIANLFPKPETGAPQAQIPAEAPPAETEVPQGILFQPISDWFGGGQEGQLGRLLAAIQQSNVYFLIEQEPSTFYNLATAVVEDARTGDWYPFARDLALQGEGGGWGNTQRFVRDVQGAVEAGADIRVSIRVASSADLHGLRDGRIAWPDMKGRSIPALLATDTRFDQLRQRLAGELARSTRPASGSAPAV